MTLTEEQLKRFDEMFEGANLESISSEKSKAVKQFFAEEIQRAVQEERERTANKIEDLRHSSLRAFYSSAVETNQHYLTGATILLNLMEILGVEKYRKPFELEGKGEHQD